MPGTLRTLTWCAAVEGRIEKENLLFCYKARFSTLTYFKNILIGM